MDTNAQNTAIAEHLGKCTHPISDWVHEGPEGDREIVCSVCRQRPYTVGFPDYTRDLNAMHEAEKTLRGYVAFQYVANLVSLRCDDSLVLITAPAAQKAEAFLKAVGKWTG